MISQEARERMRTVAAQYPSVRSAMLPALHLAQEEEGYITSEGVETVAEVLGLRPDEVDMVVSFYSMYFRKPVGRHVIKVCTSISCYLHGCDALLEHLEQRLGVKRGETTPDGVFTLLPIECLASCGTAPVLQVNNEFVENVTLEDADALLARLGQQPQTAACSGRITTSARGDTVSPDGSQPRKEASEA
jgi:NADH-quinone oxidoreductase E subunit